MKFGKKLLEHSRDPENAEWAEFYLDYNGLKTILEEKENLGNVNDSLSNSYASGLSRLSHRRHPTWQAPPPSMRFLDSLYSQIEKLVVFFLSEQGEIGIQLKECKQIQEWVTRDALERLQQQKMIQAMVGGNDAQQAAAAGDDDEEGFENLQATLERLETLRQDYHAAGMRIYRLLLFIEVNVSGVRKIIKKHDKIMRKTSSNSNSNSSPHHNHHNQNQNYLKYFSSWFFKSNSRARGSVLMRPLLEADKSLVALAAILEEALIDLTILERELETINQMASSSAAPVVDNDGLVLPPQPPTVISSAGSVRSINTTGSSNQKRVAAAAAAARLLGTTPTAALRKNMSRNNNNHRNGSNSNLVDGGGGASSAAASVSVSVRRSYTDPDLMESALGALRQQQNQQQQQEHYNRLGQQQRLLHQEDSYEDSSATYVRFFSKNPVQQQPHGASFFVSSSAGDKHPLSSWSPQVLHKKLTTTSASLQEQQQQQQHNQKHYYLHHSQRTQWLNDDVLVKIQVARNRLQDSTGFEQMLAAAVMVGVPTDNDKEGSDGYDRSNYNSDDDDQADHRRLAREQKELMMEMQSQCSGGGIIDEATGAIMMADHAEQSYRWISNQLNLLSTFLYMTNYYIVAPTSSTYAQKIGSHASVSSAIIGMTPVAALVSTVLYSWWTSYSYKSALLFAAFVCATGNILYALGLPFHSLTFVLVGRLLNGFGSARSINRRYIADTFSKKDRTAASATFVTAGALGMAAGPAIGAILDVIFRDSTNPLWQVENAPGWVMSVAWTAYFICLILFFRDPPKKNHHHTATATSTKTDEDKARAATAEKTPLLEQQQQQITADGALHNHKKAAPEAEQPIWKNVPAMVTFFVYFMLKLMLECVLSSSATLTRYFFHWTGTTAGVYLAILGLLLLPANYWVAYLSRTYDDRDLILGLVVMMLVGSISIIHYTAEYHLTQYLLASVIIFVSASALEGPNMSLLSKSIPPSWSRGILNVGLLATEWGTLGRVVADFYMTMSGQKGLEHLINHTFGFNSILLCITLGLTYGLYDQLEPLERDD